MGYIIPAASAIVLAKQEYNPVNEIITRTTTHLQYVNR